MPAFPELFTSRFGARKLIVESGLVPVRISIGHPKWPLGYKVSYSCPLLFPTATMLRMDEEEYIHHYMRQLDGTGAVAIGASLRRISDRCSGRGLVLLCFEDLAKQGEWCHRQMFASWWETETGRKVPELGEVAGKVKVRQESLFPEKATAL